MVGQTFGKGSTQRLVSRDKPMQTSSVKTTLEKQQPVANTPNPQTPHPNGNISEEDIPQQKGGNGRGGFSRRKGGR